MTNELTRPATEKEIADYLAVNDIMKEVDDDRADRIIEAIGDYAFAWKPEDKRRAYSRVYGYAKRLGATVEMLTNWYFID